MHSELRSVLIAHIQKLFVSAREPSRANYCSSRDFRECSREAEQGFAFWILMTADK
jgi:hypothetical protein